jgi:hypothetical protein
MWDLAQVVAHRCHIGRWTACSNLASVRFVAPGLWWQPRLAARRVDVRVATYNERRAFGLRHVGDRGFAYVMGVTAVDMLAPRD